MRRHVYSIRVYVCSTAQSELENLWTRRLQCIEKLKNSQSHRIFHRKPLER